MKLRYNASFVLLALTIATACARTSTPRNATAVAPVTPYIAYVANEASDVVTRIIFTPGQQVVADRRIPVGTTGRIEGPHGLAVSPDGTFYYVALSHGLPNGRVAKYRTDRDSLVGRAIVGLFPETIAITPDGQYLFVANHDLHGGDAPSGVSVVFTRTMTEVARPGTCVRPQGGRINAGATKHYSVCNVSDQLVEIDTRSFRVTHRFGLTPAREQSLPENARGLGRRAPSAQTCAPTSAEPGRGLRVRFVYVACSARDTILEIDTQLWRVTRRIPTGSSPHSVRTDPAGNVLLVSLHADSAVAVIDLATGAERGRINVAQKSPHGIAITSDGRYAFVTTEGGGAARGTVDVIDLTSARRVSSVAVGYSPGSVDILPHQ